MISKTRKGVVLEDFGKTPVLKEAPLPELQEGQLLVKVFASTVNPSDRLFL